MLKLCDVYLLFNKQTFTNTPLGRVSDIYRAYFSQALFPSCNLELGFLPRPIVVQERNPHNLMADFDAELDLYTKSQALASKIEELQKTTKGIPITEALEKVWIDMYECGYVDIEDVYLLQDWIDALLAVGYKFPSECMPKADEINTSDTLRQNISELGSELGTKSTSNYQWGECKNTKGSLTFGMADLHAGPTTDITSILTSFNQSVLHFGSKTMNNYPSVFSHPLVNKMETRRLSDVLLKYTSHSTKLQSCWPTHNYKFYQRSDSLVEVDAFLCTFPASMCQIWQNFKKPTVFLPAHRYTY